MALAFYLLAPHKLYIAWITNNPDGDTGIAAYDGLFALAYIATFAPFTRAFLVLAMLEYWPEHTTAPSTATAPTTVANPGDALGTR